MTIKNNIETTAFGTSKNAQILVQHLLELGHGRTTWKLKKKFSKTMTLIHDIERLSSWETKRYLTLLVLRDVDGYLSTLDLPYDIRQRFYSAIRNMCPKVSK
jgi:hypothetical protein